VELWAITCHFNPAGFARRRANYREFRRRLSVPLVTVELSFDGRFELEEGADADILVRLRGGDVLWQKERLLNVALAAVPEGCRKVAWLDSDVIFRSEDWAERASRLLDRCALVQLYRERRNLGAGADPRKTRATPAESSQLSIGWKIARGDWTPDDLRDANAPVSRGVTCGLAWASRRDTLEAHGLYDACILGTGDRAILCAALGRFEDGIEAVRMTRFHAEHYEAWARGFHRTVRGRIDCIDGRIDHLWHGDLRDRRYGERLRLLADHAFDPCRDLTLGENGAWLWSSEKPGLHREVREYFRSRLEDGRR